MSRPLLDRLREELTAKKLIRFFPDPNNASSPDGHEDRLNGILNTALAWLGKAQPIELVDSSTYSIPANGRLSLGDPTTSKVRKVRTIEQNGEFYEEARTDWSEGEPMWCGSWKVRHHQLFALGLYTGTIPGAPKRSGSSSANVFVERQLVAGPITLYYYGIPTEAQISDADDCAQAVVDYALHMAIRFILTQALRDKKIKMAGIPDITVNVRELQMQSKAHLDAAKGAVDSTYVATG